MGEADAEEVVDIWLLEVLEGLSVGVALVTDGDEMLTVGLEVDDVVLELKVDGVVVVTDGDEMLTVRLEVDDIVLELEVDGVNF